MIPTLRWRAVCVSLALLVGKDAPLPQPGLMGAAAKLGRFEGDAGSIIEHVYAEGDDARRLLLVGIGGGTVEEYEKAGAALTAKLLTSGETELLIDAGGVDAQRIARLATGVVLRGWRHDRYRTKLAAKHKPTLENISIVTTDPGAAAVTEGYHQRRHWDVRARVTGIDLLNRASMASLPVLRDLRAMALNALYAAGPVRHGLMRTGLGLR